MVYLDNAATTRQKFFAKDFTDETTFLNSNAEYALKTRQTLARQREIIKDCLGVKSGGIIFTRCATESAELFGKLWSTGIVCSVKEHDSVYRLERPHSDNRVWVQQRVNPLTGEIFNMPVDEPPFAMDMTAGIGKVKTPIHNGCQALWFSGHKFHAPHVGVLWLCDEMMRKRATKDEKNQFDVLHGTVDCASICALTAALQSCSDGKFIAQKQEKWFLLTEYLMRKLVDNEIGYKFIGDNEINRTLAINAILLRGINADSLQQFLASKDIYIGVGGSACAAEHDFRVLKIGYGLSQDEAEQVVRISFDEDTTHRDIEQFVDGVVGFKKRFL